MTEQEKLLSEVSEILNKHENAKRDTGREFNIFSILEVEEKETKICRVVKELLDPRGKHSQGDIYLKLFLEEVMNIHNVDSKNAIVRREDRTGEGNRVDITIDINPTYFIAIEAKINAKPSENQLERYYNDAKSKNYKEAKIVFLSKSIEDTVDIGLSENSEAKKQLKHITWSEDIIKWLELCLQQPQTQGIAPIQEILKQLISTIKKFCGQLEDGEIMDTKTLITQSPENFRNAHALAKVFDECVAEKVENFINKLKNGLNHKIGKVFDYERNNKGKLIEDSRAANNFYDKINHRCDGWISINCKYKEITFQSSKYNIAVHVQISYERRNREGYIALGYWWLGDDDALGYRLLGDDDYEKKNDEKFCEEVKKALPVNIKLDKGNSSWLYCEKYQGYFPNLYDLSDIKTLEFLSDDNRIDSFIEDFSDKIKNLVDGNP